MSKLTPEEIEAWIEQVHNGPCCSDQDDSCPSETKNEAPQK
ncbi:hypothetical protein PQO01_12930 [Lentisphaera marina]|nr:hypothetical protein [Lentisphaera marina]MDD7985851.1 hypothetical protein [Lentisphaera marina]